MGERTLIARQDSACPSGLLPNNGYDVHCIGHHASTFSAPRTDRSRRDLYQFEPLPMRRNREPTDAPDSTRTLWQADPHGVNGPKARRHVQTLSP